LIDEESRFPKATDLTLLDKLHTQHAKHPHYEKPKLSKDTFIVKHYAGDVGYTVVGFLDKNRDTLQPEVIELLQDSTSAFVRDLFPDVKDDGNATRKPKPSTTAQFKVIKWHALFLRSL
jgi:myosin-7